jgi:hypothetical protein
MPCHSTMGPCECNSCRNAHHSYKELDYISYNLTDNYQEKYPIRMKEIKQLALLQQENNFLEAALCAVLTELENIKVYESVVNAASKNGMIDVHSFWAKHQSKDEARILAELNKFSDHEKEILKKLLI